MASSGLFATIQQEDRGVVVMEWRRAGRKKVTRRAGRLPRILLNGRI